MLQRLGFDTNSWCVYLCRLEGLGWFVEIVRIIINNISGILCVNLIDTRICFVI